MNKLDPGVRHAPAHSFPLETGLVPSPGRRLLVLIPSAETADAELARRIWELASPSGLRVLFLGLCPQAGEEPALRRQLATLAAAIQDHRVSVETRISYGKNWVETVRAVWRPEDTIVCFAEQRSGSKQRPLSEELSASFSAPVHILTGLNPPLKPAGSKFLSQVLSWAGLIGIPLGFFYIQVKIDQLPKDWAHSVLFFLSVLVEIGLIWLWNSLNV